MKLPPTTSNRSPFSTLLDDASNELAAGTLFDVEIISGIGPCDDGEDGDDSFMSQERLGAGHGRRHRQRLA
eukprot:4209207-Amphidinium_carterae.1